MGSGSGWNLWVWLLGVVVTRYIDFLILLILTPLVSFLFYRSIPTFCSFKKCFFNIIVIQLYLNPYHHRCVHLHAVTSYPRIFCLYF